MKMQYIWVILSISWLMFVRCEDFDDKDIPKQDFRDRELSLVTYDGPSEIGGSDTGSKAGACVIDTNLPSHLVNMLLFRLQKIYEYYPTANQRSVQYRQFLHNVFIYDSVVVVINFDAAQYYQRWYLTAYVWGDRVLAFGW